MGASDFYTHGAGEDCRAALTAAIEQAGYEDGYSYSGSISMKGADGCVIMRDDPVPAEVAAKLANRIMEQEYDNVDNEVRFTAKDGPVGAIAVGPRKAYKERKRIFTFSGDGEGSVWREAIKRYGDAVSKVEVLEDNHTTKVVRTTGPEPERTKGYEVCTGHGQVLIYGIASVAAATKHAEEILEQGRHTELHVRRASGVIRFVERKTKSRRRRVEATVVTGSTNKVAGWLFFGTASS